MNDIPVTQHMYHCRDCRKSFPLSKLTTYYIARDDGTYPGTDLCEDCADEARNDDDVYFMVNEADTIAILSTFHPIKTVNNGDGTVTHTWTRKELV